MNQFEYRRTVRMDRLQREVKHFTARVEATKNPVTPTQRNAHTRAQRCLNRRVRDLAKVSAQVAS